MSSPLNPHPEPQSFVVLYQTEDGRTRVQCRFEGETIWLTQALMAELFQVSVPTINEHLRGLFEEGEVDRAATIRSFRIVRTEGSRHLKAIAGRSELVEAATCKPYLQVHRARWPKAKKRLHCA
jgi:hypothetical protein